MGHQTQMNTTMERKSKPGGCQGHRASDGHCGTDFHARPFIGAGWEGENPEVADIGRTLIQAIL